MDYMSNIELLKKMKDPKFYLENFCKVRLKKGGFAPFVLKEHQKDIFNTLRNNKKIICLKARQLGFSTCISAYFYYQTIMNPGITTCLIGYNSELVSELLDKIKTFMKSTPPALRPKVQYNSKYEISFPNMESKIMVLPSTENVGSGYTFNFCLLTELAKWDKAEEKMTSLMPAVKEGTVVIESSPRGVGNEFHRMVVKAERGEGEFVLKRYGWWWEYTKEEIEKIREERGDLHVAQEYEMAFLASGRPVFDQKMVLNLYKGVLTDGQMNGDHKVYTTYDGLRIYREPEPGGMYIVGGDTSEGIMGGDYSVATIWDRRTGEEVAMYRGLIAPDTLGEKLNEWGRKYNNALMVVEVNNHGLTTLTILKQKLYPSLYFRQGKIETVSAGHTDRLGWKTTKITRPLLIDEFNMALRDEVLKPHSKELMDEMTVFVYNDNNNMVAQSGFHDDCLKGETLIKTSTGYKEIKYVKSGDLVLTHKNRYKKVEACIKKPFNGYWYKMKFNGQLLLESSYNHPIYCATGKHKKTDRYVRKKDIGHGIGVSELIGYNNRKWVLPEHIKKSYHSVSIIEKLKDCKNIVIEGCDNIRGKNEKKKVKIIIDKNFSKFLGLFLAEGNCRKESNQMSIAFNENDIELMHKIMKYLDMLNINHSERWIKNRHCRTIMFVSKTLYSLMSKCYDKNKEKVFPEFAFSLGKELKNALKYWIIGDGWEDKTKSYDVIGATTSKKLALAMRDIAWSSGFYATIHKRKSIRYGKRNKDQYYVNIKYSLNKQQHLSKNNENEYIGKIRNIEHNNYNGYVYNLQIKDDRSFIADGIVVHNCIFSSSIAYQGYKVLWSGPLTQIDHTKYLLGNSSY